MRRMTILAIVVVALSAAGVNAATIYVPQDYLTIQAAIDAANDGDEVAIADGVYTGAGNKDLDFAGRPITVRSAGGDPATCVIDCEGNGRGFYFHSGEDAGSVLQGLTIRNANSDVGGVYCHSASPTLMDCMITGGTAGYGAGLYCDCDSSPTLINCTFSNNTASRGGGVGCSQDSSPTLTNCIIGANIAAYGAGLWCDQNSCPTLINCIIFDNIYSDYGAGVECDRSDPTLTNCTITGNRADYGGGALHCRYASPTLTNCMISNNSGGGNGGGLCCRYDSSPTLTGCTIIGNTCNDRGGGILCTDATATLTNCTITGNAASYGGGVDCLSLSSPMLTNCLITGNTATQRGGGVCCGESSPTLTNCMIAGNAAADQGGGLCCEFNASPSLTNCTLTGNTARAGGGIACTHDAGPTTVNCILWGDMPVEIWVESASPCVTYCDVQGGWTGVGNINADPLFRDPHGPDGDPSTLADNDYRLSAGSPCIDAGNNSEVPADELDLDADGDTAEPQPFDIAGRPRFVDDPLTPDSGSGPPPVVDMGVHEYFLDGDCDLDWSIDLSDFISFAGCMQGPAVTLESGCGCADMDIDGDVDLRDFAAFQAAFGE